ncbi:MAG: DinB family protein [Thermoanaerobaculia bacterium]|nr:DinB family protein [Thermoanaerobaculia bacterium]
MTDHRFAHSQLASCDQRFRQAATRVETLINRVSSDGARWKPSSDRWSILECLDHLVVTADAYDQPLRSAIDVARAEGPRSPPFRRGTVLGWLLVNSVTNTKRRVRTPAIFEPSSCDLELEAVVQRFSDIHRHWNQLLESVDGLDLGVRLSSPVSRWIQLSLEQALELLSQHELRHVGQAERVTEMELFPS